MNKKLNTFFFILGATAANLLIMIALFLLSLTLMLNFADPESPLVPLYIGLIFIVSIGGSFLIYTLVMKKIMAKFNLEQYLSPLFGKKYSPNKEHKD